MRRDARICPRRGGDGNQSYEVPRRLRQRLRRMTEVRLHEYSRGFGRSSSELIIFEAMCPSRRTTWSSSRSTSEAPLPNANGFFCQAIIDHTGHASCREHRNLEIQSLQESPGHLATIRTEDLPAKVAKKNSERHWESAELTSTLSACASVLQPSSSISPN